MHPISEKAAELLFCRYLFQAIGLRKAQLFAPSSWEERTSGYDQNIVGLAKFREVNLQFKSPEFVEKWSRFSIRLESRQHETLLALYPENTAFYIAHTFTSLRHANDEQVSKNLKEAKDFLKHFICVDASVLPANSRSVHYLREQGDKKPRDLSYKVQGDGSGRTDGREFPKGTWFRADALLDGLAEGTIGTEYDLLTKAMNPQDAVLGHTKRGIAGVGSMKAEDFGVCLRVVAAQHGSAGA